MDHEEQPRTRYIAATQAILAREGIAGLSVRSVAKETGFSRGLLHYHFGSLEKLTETATDDFFQHLCGRLSNQLVGGASPEQAVSRSAAALSDDDLSVVIELAAVSHRNERLREAWVEFFLGWERVLGEELLDATSETISAVVFLTTGAWFSRLRGTHLRVGNPDRCLSIFPTLLSPIRY